MKYLNRIIAIASKAIIIAFMFAVIVMAIISSLIRYYAPLLSEYKGPLLDQINSVSDSFHISAEAISGEWQPLQPVIILDNVEVEITGQDERISAKKIRLGLDLFLTIYYQSLHFEEVEIDSLSLVLKQSKAGLWGLKRTAAKATKKTSVDSLKNTVNRLWSVNNLTLDQLKISLEPYGYEKIELPMTKVELLGDSYYKYLYATVKDGKKDIGKIIFDAEGDPFTDYFSVKAYVEFSRIDVLHYLPFVAEQYGLLSAKPEGKAWLNYKDGKLDVDGALAFSELSFKKDEIILAVDDFSGSYAMTVASGKAGFWLSDAIVTHNGNRLDIDKLYLAKDSENMEIYTDQLNLEKATSFAYSFKLPEKAENILKGLNLNGDVEYLLISAPIESLSDLNIKGRLKNVTSKPLNNIPGLTNVSGNVFTSLTSGFMDVKSENFKVFFPKVFDSEVSLGAVGGRVSWKIKDKHLTLDGTEISFSSEAISSAQGEFNLHTSLIKGRGEPGRLSLNVGFSGSHSRYRNLFIPKALSQDLQRWLDKNIISGDIVQGAYMYHGPFKKDLKEYRVNQLWLDIDNAEFSYLDRWPNVRAVQGEYLLDNKESVARIAKANLQNITFNNAKLEIKPDNSGQKISILADAKVDAKKAFAFLKNDALNDLLKGQLQPWQVASGRADVSTKIHIPVGQKNKKTSIHVVADVSNLTAASKELNLKFDDIKGRLIFDLAKGLSAEKLEFDFLKQAVDATIQTDVVGGKYQTGIRYSSREFDFQKAGSWLSQPVFGFLQGRSDVSGSLLFSDKESYISFDTGLVGVEVDLPQPFGKNKAEKLPVMFKLPLSGEGRIASLQYGKSVKAELQFGEEGLRAIAVDLGVSKSRFKNKKIVVSGQLLEVNVEKWLSVIDEYESHRKLYEGSSGQADVPWALSLENVSINKLNAFDYKFENARVSLFNTSAYWQLGFDHSQLKGSLKIYDEKERPFDADVNFLELMSISRLESDGKGQGKVGITDLPDVNFTVHQLSIDKENYGEWEFELRSDSEEVRFENLRGDVRHLMFGPVGGRPASLRWGIKDGEIQTSLFAKIVSKDLASALAAFGYSQEVNSKHAEFDVDIFWQGKPEDFQVTKLVGSASIDLEDGNFADAQSSSTEALKFLSAMNLAELVRRLKLDFSDLTTSGLAFDKVSGDMHLNEGVFTFIKPLKVEGSSSEILLQGNMDVVKSELDLSMGITLPFASNLPWIAALAAGLPAAAGVYVISKVFNKQVKKLSSALYKITGSMNEPDIEFVKIFGSES